MWPVVGNIFDIKNILGGRRNSNNYITFTTVAADPTIYIECNSGDTLTIRSISGGVPLIQTYACPFTGNVAIQADAGTNVKIVGDVYSYSISITQGCDISSIDISHCQTLMGLLVDGQNNIATIDVTHNPGLRALFVQYCSQIADIDTSASTDLETLVFISIPLQNINVQQNTALRTLGINTLDITSLDISNNTLLDTLVLLNVPNINLIRARSDWSDVADKIAQAITDANGIGTIYTNADGAYYSTIETAANNKGWTIEQL